MSPQRPSVARATRVFICCLAAVCASSTIASAQLTVDGAIRGVVRDEQGAVLVGVVITATSPDAPLPFSTLTDDSGTYRLRDLPPGTYTVSASLDGFSTITRDNLLMRAGLSLGLDLELRLGNRDETVVVRAQTPLLETRAGTTGINISGDLQRALPGSSRHTWVDALLLVPNVVTREGPNPTMAPTILVRGADQGSQVIQIDGSEVTSALQSSVGYVRLSDAAIADMQVKTGGVDASAPLGVGAVVNIATTTGTNVFRGSVSGNFQAQRWNGSNVAGGTSGGEALVQPEFVGGGPLRRDRLWFTANYRYTFTRSNVSRTAANLQTLQAIVPTFEPFMLTNRLHWSFLKAVMRLNRQHQLSGFYQHDHTPSESANAFTVFPSRLADGGPVVNVKLDSTWTDTLLTRLSASYNNKYSPLYADHADEPQRAVFQTAQLSGSRVVGAGQLALFGATRPSASEQPARKLTVAFDATALRQWRGSHDVQAGVYYQRLYTAAVSTYVNGGFVLEESVLRDATAPDRGYRPFHRQLIDATTLETGAAVAHDVALYAQDSWTPHARLTVTAGVRIDLVRRTDRLFDVPLQRSTDIGPRFSFNYALTSSGHHRLRGYVGRVHDAVQQTAVRAGANTPAVQDLYDADGDGLFEIALTTPASSALNPNRTIDLDRWHQPYVTDLGLAYSVQPASGLQVDISATRRTYRDRIALVETNAVYDGGQFRGYQNEALNQIYRVTNNAWNSPIVTALEVSLSGRLRQAQFLASYARNWRELAGTWQPDDPARVIQPEAFSNNKGIGTTTSIPTVVPIQANSLDLQAAAFASQWQDHVMRAGASVVAPWDLLLATNYSFQSGVWSGPILTRIDAPDPAFGPARVTLSNGRVVDNPLSTQVRFAYPTRGDGQLRTRGYHLWNLRIGRRFRGLAHTTLDAAVDIYNVTNRGTDLLFIPTLLTSPTFGQTTSRQRPRAGQVSVRLTF